MHVTKGVKCTSKSNKNKKAINMKMVEFMTTWVSTTIQMAHFTTLMDTFSTKTGTMSMEATMTVVTNMSRQRRISLKTFMTRYKMMNWYSSLKKMRMIT